jgi:hypothetical protein
MKKFSILLLFFTLCIFHSSTIFGQRVREYSKDGALIKDTILMHRTVHNNRNGIMTLNGDTISGTIGSITIDGGRIPDFESIPDNRIIISGELTKPTRHYYEKDGERYYIESVPPTQKGKRIDDSNVWLLNNEVAQAWH